MDPKSFCCVNLLGYELFLPSLSVLLCHKKLSPRTYIFFKRYYNRHQFLTIYMDMIHIFGVITRGRTDKKLTIVHLTLGTGFHGKPFFALLHI